MNEEQFEQEQLDRDNAYKQALARVEADNRQLQLIVNSHANMRDTAQAQLAEAVGLLGTVAAHYVSIEKPEFAVRLNDFLARHAQAEQQEAKPVAVEAQGAQAGDLACAVRVLLEVPQLQGEQAFSAQPIIDRVRAALATPPAAGEPVAPGVKYADEVDLIRAVLEGYPPSIARTDALCSVKLLKAYFAAPACHAAHGDDAERFEWLISNVCMGSIGFGDWWMNADEPASEWRAAIDAAMRAQGDGEVQ